MGLYIASHIRYAKIILLRSPQNEIWERLILLAQQIATTTTYRCIGFDIDENGQTIHFVRGYQN